MSANTIILTREQDAFVEDAVRSGDYASKSDAVGHALLLLARRRKRRTAKVERLRALIDEGIAAIEAGDYIVVKGDELEAWMDSLTADERPRSA